MLLSIVIPVYNEAHSLGLLLAELRSVTDRFQFNWEAVFVDDGSSDNSRQILREAAAADPRFKILGFSRNFGHQAAVTAGLDFARGDAVVVMDADLQDPPELLQLMVDLFQQGYDVVSAQRVSREGESTFKQCTADLFYWVMRHFVDCRLMPEVGDFRLLSRRAVLALRGFREEHRFMRGLISWLGLKEILLPFHRRPRAAGKTKYHFGKMAKFAWTAVCSFSALPLRLCTALGILLGCAGFGYLLVALRMAYFAKTAVRGWTSIVALQCVFSGITLVALGLIGEYLAKVYEESKGRPLYVVADLINLLPPNTGVARASIIAQPVLLAQDVGDYSGDQHLDAVSDELLSRI